LSYREITDAFGFSKANTYLVVNIPASGNAFCFRVIERRNQGYPTIDYGPLPINSGQALSTYAGASTTAPAAGALAAESFTNSGLSFTQSNPPNSTSSAFTSFASGTVFDTSDIFHIPAELDKDTLFDVTQDITPKWLRVAVNIPTNQNQQAFQIGSISGGVGTSFGWRRGWFNVIHFPGLIYGYNWGNDTNIPCNTNVRLRYAEYKIEIVKNPELVFGILSKSSPVPVNWKTLPVAQYPATLAQQLKIAYGFEGFPLYGSDQRAKAIPAYTSLIAGALV